VEIKNLTIYLNFAIILASIGVILLSIITLKKITSKKESYLKSIFKSSFIGIILGYCFWTIAEVIWGIQEYLGKNPEYGIAEYFYTLGYFSVFFGLGKMFVFMSKNKDKFSKYFLTNLILLALISFLSTYLNICLNQNLPLRWDNLTIYDFYPILSSFMAIISGSLYLLFKKEKIMKTFFGLIFLSSTSMYLGDMLYNYYILGRELENIKLISNVFFLIEYLIATYSFYHLNKFIREKNETK
jgi:hypothetical protein